MSTTTDSIPHRDGKCTSDNVEAIRLAVEVICLIRRFGYKVKDDTVLEVIELCTRVADEDLP